MNATATSPMAIAALTYARNGIAIIPLHDATQGKCSCYKKAKCGTPGKHPRTKNGSTDATSDEATIRLWWTTWPKANIGIATGSAYGLFMVGPDGATGIEQFAKLLAENGPLPPTWKARSGGGGEHYFFVCPLDLKIGNSANHRGLKIDVRGDGGLAVASPSRHASGNTYDWLSPPDETPLACAPPWLIEWCCKEPIHKDATEERLKQFDARFKPQFTQRATNGAHITDRAIKYLSKMPPAIQGSNGSDAAMSAARCMVYGFDLGEEAGFDLLWEHYNHRCVPPWSEKELRHKCEDADTKPFDKPRGWLLASASTFNGPTNGSGHRKAANSVYSVYCGSKQGEDKSAESEDSEESREESRTEQKEPPTDFSDWPAPLPFNSVVSVPHFPIDVLPDCLRALADEMAWAMNIPPDFAGVPMLTMAGAAIGNSRRLHITASHKQPALLYSAIVSPPGSLKSPPMDMLQSPFEERQEQFNQEHVNAVAEWQDTENPGPPPIVKQCFVSNVTTESLSVTLAENPRGVLMTQDELLSLVNGMNQYKQGRGNDRQFYLSAWSQATITINRKSDRERYGRPTFIRNPFVAIFGNLQNDVLSKLRGEGSRGAPPPNDGWQDRFLLVVPDELPDKGEEWRAVSIEARDGWRDLINNLFSLEMARDGENLYPGKVDLRSCAKEVWESFTHSHADERNKHDFPPYLRGNWSKLKGYCGRLALIVHYLRLMSQETIDKDIDAESMIRAVKLVDYFKGHAEKVFSLLDADPQIAEAKKVLRWIMSGKRIKFTKRELYQAFRPAMFQHVTQVDPVLSVLQRHFIIFPVEPEDRLGAGRPKSPTWLVNPRIYEADFHAL